MAQDRRVSLEAIHQQPIVKQHAKQLVRATSRLLIQEEYNLTKIKTEGNKAVNKTVRTEDKFTLLVLSHLAPSINRPFTYTPSSCNKQTCFKTKERERHKNKFIKRAKIITLHVRDVSIHFFAVLCKTLGTLRSTTAAPRERHKTIGLKEQNNRSARRLKQDLQVCASCPVPHLSRQIQTPSGRWEFCTVEQSSASPLKCSQLNFSL